MCATLLLVASASASGQLVFSLSAESDYRYRGTALNQGKPDLRLNLDLDHKSGCYAGGALTQVEFYAPRRQAQWLAYGGCTNTLADGLSGEVGLTHTRFARDPVYNYSELYAGVAASHWNLRLYRSPSYYGGGLRTAYLEVNAGLPIELPWRVVAHLGALRGVGGSSAPIGHERIDARLGLATAFGDSQWQLARVSGQPQGIYPVTRSIARQAWVLSSTLPF